MTRFLQSSDFRRIPYEMTGGANDAAARWSQDQHGRKSVMTVKHSYC
ncbi:hypothetical protein [Reichenbachiella sp.]